MKQDRPGPPIGTVFNFWQEHEDGLYKLSWRSKNEADKYYVSTPQE